MSCKSKVTAKATARIVEGTIAPTEPDTERARARGQLWHSFALHGGAPCSHYVGHYRDALILALRYKQEFGGRIGLEMVG